MKQQLLEQRMAEIEAIAQQGLKTGGHAAALVDIIRVIKRPS